ncbi:MAG: pilus assembly protein [Verrucomicrobia bacterium]|nr:pilus assembly protein [Verrucomicrobiota bacterium]
MKSIADTGLIVALLAADDPAHAWAVDAFRHHGPFHTCDAVLAEACSFFPTPGPVLTLVARGDLVLDFELATELPRVLALVTKYADQPMDLADACVVRMSELAADSRVWTVDRADFTAYRRNGRQSVPSDFPPKP